MSKEPHHMVIEIFFPQLCVFKHLTVSRTKVYQRFITIAIAG